MSLKEKYKALLDLGTPLDAQEMNGQLVIKGQAKSPFEKDRLWDKIKEIGGNQPGDLSADITVADGSCYHRHKVQSGDTLSKISKIYYKDANRYMKIFEANKHLMINPDTLHPDMVLTIPNP